MGTIRVYRHPVGTAPANPTLVTQFDDADGGAFSSSFTVDAGTLPAGTYDITVTNQDTGKAVSGYSNAITPVQVNAAGISDNFTGADGSALSANWTVSNPDPDKPIKIYNNRAAIENTMTFGDRVAVWAGTPLAANQTVIGQLNVGTNATRFARLIARSAAVGSPLAGALVELRQEGTGAYPRYATYVSGAVQAGYLDDYSGAAGWFKIVVSGSVATFYYAPDNAGSPGAWVLKHTIDKTATPAEIPASGQPAISFKYDGAVDPQDANVWIDNFSAS